MKRHEFDPVSFVFGLVFVGIGLTAALADEDVTFLEARWVWPALLVAAGLGVLGFSMRARRAESPGTGNPHDPVDP
jgi:hypothetical protein